MSAHPISVNPNVQGGTPCFAGTRVPVSTLFDLLEQGYSLEEFLLDFPSVERAQAVSVLELAKADLPRHAIMATSRGR